MSVAHPSELQGALATLFELEPTWEGRLELATVAARDRLRHQSARRSL